MADSISLADSIPASQAEEVGLVLPHLPGFRAPAGQAKIKRRHLLSNRAGLNFVEDPEDSLAPARTLLATNSATSLTGIMKPSVSSLALAPNLDHATRDHPVLCFFCYFKEAVHESNLENYRVRKCELFYYTGDDTIQIVERKQENSGTPQGNFMRRHKVPKNDDQYVTLDDIDIDSYIEIYRRVFHIVGANSSTMKWLHANREHVGDQVDFPLDQYEVDRAVIMTRETGKDMSVFHGIKKNPMKSFAEAMLGNTVNNSGREGFLRFDRQVLRFTCLWDDRANLYGDLQQFKAHYFLTDNSIEVLAVYGPNSGRDPYPLLLKRTKLPKDPADERAGFYHWSDLTIGGTMTVYSRELVLVDADDKTREFYEANDMPLSPPMLPEPEAKVTVARQVPPHTGFGSEEDSLTSCVGSLVPTAPKKIRGETRTLRFLARLCSIQPEDEGREFVLQFFLVDQTLSIREPPRRNSGIVGGNFLKRGLNQARDDNDMPITQGWFFIGAIICVGGHSFEITDSDEHTIKHMERTSLSSNGSIFPHSHYRQVMLNLGASLRPQPQSAVRNVVETLGGAARKLDLSALQALMQEYNLSMHFPQQALITIIRKLAGPDGGIEVGTFLEELESPSVDEGGYL